MDEKFLDEHELTPEEIAELEESNATSTELKLYFLKSNGNEMSMTVKYARQDASNANIKALMQGIIANGAIFENTPVALKAAKIVTTETTDVDLS